MTRAPELTPDWVEGLRTWILEVVRTEVHASVAEATRPAEFFTVREAAGFARVSAGLVRRWVREGRVVPYGVGGRGVRVRREDIERVLREGSPRRTQGTSWRRNRSQRLRLRCERIPHRLQRVLQEIRALLRGWYTPDHVTPEMIAEHIIERSHLERLLKDKPTAMSQDDRRRLSAYMNSLRWATQTTKEPLS